MEDWLNRFTKYAMLRKPPLIFAKWAAVSALSSIVQRRQWFTFKGENSYLHLYTILAGPPGVGKGLAMKPMIELLKEIPDQHIAPDTATAQGLADELSDSYVAVVTNDHKIETHALTVLCTELGNFLPEYENVMINRLIKLWDGEGYEERTRGKGKLKIPNAHLNFIAGTTPSYLAGTIPDIAWEGGFMSRCVIVFHARESKYEFFQDASATDKNLFAGLVRDGINISQTIGQLTFTEEAVKTVMAWADSGFAPKQAHPKLSFYNTRRPHNMLKLSCLSAISRGSIGKVEAEDVDRMIQFLIETEEFLPDIFKAMRTGGDGQVIKEAWYFMYQLYMGKAQQKPIPKSYLIRFLQERVPAHSVDRILQVMIDARFIIEHEVNKVGVAYVPAEPHE